MDNKVLIEKNISEEVHTDISNKTYNSVELFAGAGGLALGLEYAGFNEIALIDNDKYACKTLKRNKPEWNVIERDIIDIVRCGIKNYLPNDIEIDMVSGGYPCQSFSYAGNKMGLNDIRGTMFYYYARILDKLKPKVFLVENVKGLISHNRGKTLKAMVETFKGVGYNIKYKILNAYDYNVAQKRERIFIVGVRKDFDINTYTYPEPYNHKLVLKDVLKEVPYSVGVKYSQEKESILALVPAGGCWRDLPENIAKEYMGKSYYSEGGKTGVARRISWDKPCPTLVCNPYQKQTELCHPDETRPLTTREYARIQGFPDGWVFEGSISNIYKQIGNAVPVNLAKAVGLSIIKFLNELE